MTSLLSYLLACYKMELKSTGNYTHPSTDKVMPRSQFLIRFTTRSLVSVTKITTKVHGNHKKHILFRIHSQIDSAKKLFFQTFSATVCSQLCFSCANVVNTWGKRLG